MSGPRRTTPDERRRGWCPGLARPMPTGDGLLARVHPPLGGLTRRQMRAVAQGARRYGNGLIDITGRANLQLRGVTDATRAALARSLAATGLGDVRADGGPQRLTLASPLAGLDPGCTIDVAGLARAVEAVGLTVEGLPPKTLVAIDGGGRCGPGVGGADILLVADAPDRVVLGLAAPDMPLWCGTHPIRQVPGMLGLALSLFAASGERRMRDLDESRRAEIAAVTGCLEPVRQRREPTPLAEPGVIPIDPRRSVIVAEAPFGRCAAEQFERVAALAASGIRLTASRGLVLIAPPRTAAAVRDEIAALGLITEPGDPRRAVAACPGAPACASGTTPVPDHAARLAEAFAPFAARGAAAHVSGCAKGCAHPSPTALTLVGDGGAYDVVVDGAPDDRPAMRLTFEAALERVRRADPGKPVAEIFGTQP